jgi:solute carrier family 13 (sodium-dependent dicarboxylate transporter), member 2/3/5
MQDKPERDQAGFDILDMNNYRIEKLPKRQKSKFEQLLAIMGPPLALIVFIYFGFFAHFSFLEDVEPASLVAEKARQAFDRLGAEAFARSNHLMLAIFIAAIALWITEAIPNYLTSLILIVSLVLTGVLPERDAYAQLGHPVMWLNIMSFVLASMLVKTGVAKKDCPVVYIKVWQKCRNYLFQLYHYQYHSIGIHFGNHSKGSHFIANIYGDCCHLRCPLRKWKK